jgi:PiT family inorganic phosphate transporter
MFILRKTIRNKTIFEGSNMEKAPPMWIRTLLIATCTGVSFSHGSNDGQKGVGLIMLILIGIIPAQFALDRSKHPEKMLSTLTQIETSLNTIEVSRLSNPDKENLIAINSKIDSAKATLSHISNFDQLPDREHFALRKDILVISKMTETLLKNNEGKQLSSKGNHEAEKIKSSIKSLKTYTEYAPWWVILMISFSLGVGTMIGWKRIVITIGEKIGKSNLTYAQGASAQLVAAGTISLSSMLGLPVSTTHVLSSGIAGSMVEEDGFKNLQPKTIKNIALAWVITLPVTIVMAGALFLLIRWILV